MTSPIGKALTQSARDAGASIEILEDDFTRWSSATFEGARHLVKIEGLRCAAMDDWLDRLPEATIEAGRRLVADLVVAARLSLGGLTTAYLEVLTVDAR